MRKEEIRKDPVRENIVKFVGYLKNNKNTVIKSFVGLVLLKLTNDKLKKWGKERQFHSALTLKQLQQSFTSIREIILNNLENIFLNKYHYHNLENAKAGRNKDTVMVFNCFGACV